MEGGFLGLFGAGDFLATRQWNVAMTDAWGLGAEIVAEAGCDPER
jgi:hypothetical protein